MNNCFSFLLTIANAQNIYKVRNIGKSTPGELGNYRSDKYEYIFDVGLQSSKWTKKNNQVSIVLNNLAFHPKIRQYSSITI